MDDRTVGLVLRALRMRRGWRQRDLACRVGCSQSVVSRVEAGHLAEVTVERLRQLFLAVEARLEVGPRWRGADLERLLDADHAATAALVARRLDAAGWTVAVEVTYSEYGERGSIDVLAVQAATRAALVVEVKTEIASAEQIGRKLDEKTRLAPKIVRDRFGWTPASIGRVLAMPDRSTLRRIVEATPILGRMLPVDARAVRRWLARPVGAFAGSWYLSGIAPGHRRQVRTPVRAPSQPVAGVPSTNPESRVVLQVSAEGRGQSAMPSGDS